MSTLCIVYSVFSKRIELRTVDMWSWKVLIEILVLLLSPVSEKKDQLVYLRSKILPGNRYIVIQLINKWLLYKLVLLMLKKFSSIQILWIKNLDYVSIHNFLRYTYLVLDLKQALKAEPGRYFYLREYFLKGWSFGYRVHRKPIEGYVFKNKTSLEIISDLLKNSSD